VQNDGGQITSMEETACPEGTTFVVRELFYNTPVRLKFLKKPVTEAGLVSDLMMRLILSRPDVSFRYISQGKTLYHSAGDGQLESAVFSIYGMEMKRTMRRVHGCESGLVLDGYVGIGEGARGNRSHESFFINGRYMRSGLLSSAVESGVRERVMIGKFPTCVLHLTMPFDQVDVNVHPNKLEVRFQNEAAIAQAVENIVRDSITDRDALEHPTPMLLTEEERPVMPVQVTKMPPAVTQSHPTVAKSSAVPAMAPVTANVTSSVPPGSTPVEEERYVQRAPIPSSPVMRSPSADVRRYLEADTLPPPASSVMETAKTVSQPPVQGEQVESFLPEAPKPMKLLGVAFNTFILVEYEDHLLMIDQHAVHERLLFDKLSKAYDQHEAGQELLIPLVLTVSRREQELLEENRSLLESIGLSVEPFGDNEISVRSLPMILGQPQAADFVRDILDQLQSERGQVSMEKRRSSILQMACKKAVKGGDPLSEDDIRDLVSRMIDQKVTPTCPHGRPLVVAISHTELDKRFKRIQ
jgi:DNA mismatch repair protein MutL